MKRILTALGIVVLGLAIGVSEVIYRSVFCRNTIGHIFGRGQLLALVAGRGIYEIDLQREVEADAYLEGIVCSPANRSQSPPLRRGILTRLIANENVRRLSKDETVLGADLQREVDLLHCQFVNEKAWANAIRLGTISGDFLREQCRAELRARRWLEHAIGRGATASEELCRAHYAAHLAEYSQPLRLRATHLFLAAPPETAPEIVEAKRQRLDWLMARMINGEQFPQLIWEACEDEATKRLGGDLNYFSSWRMPSEFFDAVFKLKVGETPKPVRSHLGFHLVQLTEIKPARELSFDEVRTEIARFLTNRNRQTAMQHLSQEMGNHAEYLLP
jgi:hypothetical protein